MLTIDRASRGRTTRRADPRRSAPARGRVGTRAGGSATRAARSASTSRRRRGRPRRRVNRSTTSSVPSRWRCLVSRRATLPLEVRGSVAGRIRTRSLNSMPNSSAMRPRRASNSSLWPGLYDRCTSATRTSRDSSSSRRERGRAARPEQRRGEQGRLLDVLGVVVAAADDEDVLEPAGDGAARPRGRSRDRRCGGSGSIRRRASRRRSPRSPPAARSSPSRRSARPPTPRRPGPRAAGWRVSASTMRTSRSGAGTPQPTMPRPFASATTRPAASASASNATTRAPPPDSTPVTMSDDSARP